PPRRRAGDRARGHADADHRQPGLGRPGHRARAAVGHATAAPRRRVSQAARRFGAECTARRDESALGDESRARGAALRRLRARHDAAAGRLSFGLSLSEDGRNASMTLQYPNIDPIALQIGPVAIHWYGITYL